MCCMQPYNQRQIALWQPTNSFTEGTSRERERVVESAAQLKGVIRRTLQRSRCLRTSWQAYNLRTYTQYSDKEPIGDTATTQYESLSLSLERGRVCLSLQFSLVQWGLQSMGLAIPPCECGHEKDWDRTSPNYPQDYQHSEQPMPSPGSQSRFQVARFEASLHQDHLFWSWNFTRDSLQKCNSKYFYTPVGSSRITQTVGLLAPDSQGVPP